MAMLVLGRVTCLPRTWEKESIFVNSIVQETAQILFMTSRENRTKDHWKVKHGKSLVSL